MTDKLTIEEIIKNIFKEYSSAGCQYCGGGEGDIYLPEENWDKTIDSILRRLGWSSNRPKIICLCGSTRFTDQMLIKQWELTKQGYIVLSWCALPENYFLGPDQTHIGDQEGVKGIVDAVHFHKIELANEVMILNIGGYIGESTRNEIEYAKKLGKSIKYLEPIHKAK